ncbi:MAG: hypothetical protein MUC62_06775 [Candidatus Thermoplasmatota archaeon]|nr:hypothetical protein [Candidatus Thermoplasmatota archaeon]
MITWLFIVYAVIGALSLVVLVVMMVLGGLDMDIGGVDLDMDGTPDVDLDIGGGHGDIGPLSIPVILSFTSGFGGMGAILTYLEVSPFLTPILAAVGALLMSVVLFFVMQAFMKQFTSDSTVSFSKMMGKRGSVTVPIHPGREGQIAVFTEQRGRTLIPAVADTFIDNNSSVSIVKDMGDAVKVIPRGQARKGPSGLRTSVKETRVKGRDKDKGARLKR